MVNIMSKALHVFVVESRFQALSALLIAEAHANDEALIVCHHDEIRLFLARFPFVTSCYIPLKNNYWFLKRQRNYRYRLNRVLEVINSFKDFDNLQFYCAKLDPLYSNLFIKSLPKKMPDKKIDFNIIPDGQSNFRRNILKDSDRRKMIKKSKSLLNRLFGLHYYVWEKEWRGIDDDIISKIYLLPSSPNEYDAKRVVDLPLPNIKKYVNVKPLSGRVALVVGGKHVDRKILSHDEERAISEKVAVVLAENNITEVHYIKHPVARNFDLLEPAYKIIETNVPAEMLMLENNYTLVVGISSTSLFVGRLLCDENCSVYSVGLDTCLDRYPLAPYIKQAFQGLGIKLVN
jgi:hypothetical protein